MGLKVKLIPMNDPNFWQKKLLDFYPIPEARSRLGRAARRRALLYDQRLTLNQLLKFLNV